MGRSTGDFNRFGKVGADLGNEPDQEPVAETVSDEEASDSELAEEAEVVDADGDGHDDATGEFVEGNTEAADTNADEAELADTEQEVSEEEGE